MIGYLFNVLNKILKGQIVVPNATNADNADKLDGFHASQTPGANLIPVADSSGKLAGDWYIVAQSLGTSGYIKFSNGLIIQWGKYATSNNNPVTINYPITFPNNVFTVVISIQDGWAYATVAKFNGTPTVSSFSVIVRDDTGALRWTDYIYWIAIGY